MAEGGEVVGTWIVDTEDLYRWPCVLLGHRWRRIAYTLNWVKPKSCHRCAGIPAPWPPRA